MRALSLYGPAVVLAVIFTLARAGEPTDFEKKILAAGKDSRPKALSVQLSVVEEKEGGEVQKGLRVVDRKFQGMLRYDGDAQVMVTDLKRENRRLGIEDGKPDGWLKIDSTRFTSSSADVELILGKFHDNSKNCPLPVITKEGLPNEHLGSLTYCLFSSTGGIEALNKLYAFEASTRKEEGVIWFKLVPRKGEDKGSSREVAIDEKTGNIVATTLEWTSEGVFPGKSSKMSGLTTARYTYGEVPKDLGPKLKTEVDKALAAAKTGEKIP